MRQGESGCRRPLLVWTETFLRLAVRELCRRWHLLPCTVVAPGRLQNGIDEAVGAAYVKDSRHKIQGEQVAARTHPTSGCILQVQMKPSVRSEASPACKASTSTLAIPARLLGPKKLDVNFHKPRANHRAVFSKTSSRCRLSSRPSRGLRRRSLETPSAGIV